MRDGSCIPNTDCMRCANGWLLKSDDIYPTLRCGDGGAGGGYTCRDTQGARSVEQDIRIPFRWEICRTYMTVSSYNK